MNPSQDRTVDLWLTTADQKNLLTYQEPISLKEDLARGLPIIQVDPNIKFQTMEGFGAAITGSAAYLMNNKLSSDQKESLLKDLFTEEGIHMSFIRHTIGASDFSVDEDGSPASFTYNDIETEHDYHLDHFTIEKDEDVITLLQDIVSKNEQIKIFGTPWTAPAWMKAEKTLNGWFLDYENKKVYQTYADYFLKYIKAYQDKGIPIEAISIQNEPVFTSDSYPSMSMSAEEQAMFIREYLGPAFLQNNISTKIIGFDHNWSEGLNYASTLLHDEETRKFTDGTAFHCYEGNPSSMSDVHAAYQDKNIYLTECSGGEWSADFGSNLSWYLTNLLIGGPRNWASTVMLWNTALDEYGGPANGGCTNCRGVVTIDQNSGKISKNVEYYAIGHASKFVEPGAVRIGSTSYKGDLESVAFQNPDDSIILIMINSGKEDQSFQVNLNSEYFSYTLQPNSAVTFKWDY
ncbi:glycoside hydrolase family 30 protein [Cytobacillus gottheilii]|uniref:glycoside hydrolase family 30 protein n=1 Tax=Cytobacillus gottheilii TaxID=859144 RepID=UPI00249599BD|nr:glycoside hydrolase family 30 beta sandwich domain-containing protein [Cytobacillus gottheilii]